MFFTVMHQEKIVADPCQWMKLSPEALVMVQGSSKGTQPNY